ncbi:MAG: IS1380 family transposase, partial [Methylococcales bacterium]|nr:IS1380 family transposase [Methylococcales bacterium]
MRKYKLEQSNKEITSRAGMVLIGSALENFTSITKTIDLALPKRHGTPTSDIIKAYIGIVSQGKNDFEAIN